MKSRLIAISITGLLVTLSSPVLAENEFQGDLYAVPGIGAMRTDGDLKADSVSPAYSLRLGKEVSPHWDVQLGVSHARASENTALYNGGKFKQTLLGVDALYMFSRDSLRPFLLAGMGGAYNSVNYAAGTNAAARGSNASWMANVGMGVQYLVTDNLGLQADVRQVWSSAESTTLFGAGKKDSVIGNTYLNLGLIFKFGAPKQVAMAEPIMEATMADIAPTEEEPLPPLSDEPTPPVNNGPDKPVFEKLTLQAEVLFDFDQSILKTDGKKVLDSEVAAKMKAHPEVELILITGHADRIGVNAYNQQLSERRAQAVKNYLSSDGIAPTRMRALGKGESQPVVDCKGVRGKKLIKCLQPNRRVVVVEVEIQVPTQK